MEHTMQCEWDTQRNVEIWNSPWNVNGILKGMQNGTEWNVEIWNTQWNLNGMLNRMQKCGWDTGWNVEICNTP